MCVLAAFIRLHMSTDKWQLSGESIWNRIQPFFHGVQVREWMFFCLKRRTRNLSIPSSFWGFLWPWSDLLHFSIHFKMGTINLRCFSCVVCAESSGVLQLFRPKDVYQLEQIFLYFSKIHSTTQIMLPKECVLPCLMYATQAELLASK